MAIYDGAAAEQREIEEKAYNDLLASLKQLSGGNGGHAVHAYYPALARIRSMEKELSDLREKQAQYDSFFRNLQSFLPRTPSIHDRIG